METFRILFAIFLVITIFELVIIIRKNSLRKTHRAVRDKLAGLPSQLRDCSNDREIYDKILATLVSVFSSTSEGSLLIIDQDEPEKMYFKAVYNLDKNLLDAVIPTEKSFLYLTNQFKEVAIVNNPVILYGDMLNTTSDILKDRANSITQCLMAPIYFEDKVYGVVNISSRDKNKFKKADMELLKYILCELSMILEYFITKNKMSYVIEFDSLTKVHSRDAFLGRLNIYLQTLTDEDESVFVMIDIDNFKEINDTFGHLTGDQALTYFAETLKKNIESEDDCGRYGGDEFVILFKNCTMEKAISKMTELQNRFIDEQFLKNVSIKFSYGIVLINKSSNYTLQEVVKKGDFNMYKSKGGKNSQIK